MNKKVQPIRVNDRFSDGKTDWTVIQTWPGGRLELFDSKRARFSTRYHREVKEWQRIGTEGVKS